VQGDLLRGCGREREGTPGRAAGTAGMEFFVEDDPADILAGTHTGHVGMIATIPF